MREGSLLSLLEFAWWLRRTEPAAGIAGLLPNSQRSGNLFWRLAENFLASHHSPDDFRLLEGFGSYSEHVSINGH